MSDIDQIAKRRGFFWQSSDMYGAIGGFYDYGHLGTSMKRRFENLWRSYFLGLNVNFHEIETSLIMPEKVFAGSGHLVNFNDPIVSCPKCGYHERADKLLEVKLEDKFEGLSFEDLDKIIRDNNITCEECDHQLNETSSFSLMFPVEVGPYAKLSAYLRPETAQGVFVNFAREFEVLRKKLPLGLAMVGKAFRNEISPRQGLQRTREFTQAELQIFFDQDTIDNHQKWDEVKNYKLNLMTSDNRKEVQSIKCSDVVKKLGLPKFYVYYMAKVQEFYLEILKVDSEKFRLFQLNDEEKAFYNKFHWDVEFEVEGMGWTEVGGIHYRTDHDLKGHEDESGQSQEVFYDEKKFIPHVLELSFGVDRNLYALLSSALTERDGKDILTLPYRVAPYDVAIFPLMKKDGLPEKAEEIFNHLREKFTCFYDETGSIGKRYARVDEVGVPFAITIDHDTMDGKGVTIRSRDTTDQERVKEKDLISKIDELLG